MSQDAGHPPQPIEIEVLCVGTAAYDLIFMVDAHPGPDDKVAATRLLRCGGGPASNAAVAVARLGGSAAFAGYLGDGAFGNTHLQELRQAGVETHLVVRGSQPTSLSSILVKPDGSRTVINYPSRPPLPADSVSFDGCRPKAMLFDGHEPYLAAQLLPLARRRRTPTILDAGSERSGAASLAASVDFLVASERFSEQVTGEADPLAAAARLNEMAPVVVITRGEKGLVWSREGQQGRMPAFAVAAVDSTGAGDTFHGAFAYGLVRGMPWEPLLRFSSAAAALCCTRMGARLGIPSLAEVEAFLAAAPGIRA